MDIPNNNDLLLASIIESSNDAIFFRNADGTIITWNRGAEDLFGYSSSEIIGKSVEVLFPPELVEEGRSLIDAINNGQLVTNVGTVRLRKNGSRVHVSLTVSLVKNQGGSIIGVSVIARDITKQKNTEDRIRRSEERIRRFLDSIQIGVYVVDKDGKPF